MNTARIIRGNPAMIPLGAGPRIIYFSRFTLFAFANFLTMTFVKHGDIKAEAPKGLDTFEDLDT